MMPSLPTAFSIVRAGIIEKQLSAQEEKLNDIKRKLDAEGGTILLIDAANDSISVKDDRFFTSRLLTLAGFTYVNPASVKSRDVKNRSSFTEMLSFAASINKIVPPSASSFLLMSFSFSS